MSSEHIEHEVANNRILINELLDKVGKLEKSPGGVLMPRTEALPGPGNAYVSRVEFNRMREGLVNEIEALKAQLGQVADIATEAVRVLDRMAGMGK